MSSVSRGELESKLREIQRDFDDAATTAKPAGLTIGGAVIAGAVGIAYVLGQRKTKKQTTVVEIRRV